METRIRIFIVFAFLLAISCTKEKETKLYPRTYQPILTKTEFSLWLNGIEENSKPEPTYFFDENWLVPGFRQSSKITLLNDHELSGVEVGKTPYFFRNDSFFVSLIYHSGGPNSSSIFDDGEEPLIREDVFFGPGNYHSISISHSWVVQGIRKKSDSFDDRMTFQGYLNSRLSGLVPDTLAMYCLTTFFQ